MQRRPNTNRSIHLITGLTTALMLLSPMAQAQKKATSDDKKVQALYDRAIALYNQNQYAQSARLFRELATVSNDCQHLFTAGEIQYAAGRYDLSIEAFEAFLETGKDAINAEDRQYAQKAIEDVASTVGYLHVEAKTPVEVWIDQEHRGDTPLRKAIAVMEGEHAVVLKENGEMVKKVTVFISSQETVSIPRRQDKSAAANTSPAVAPTQPPQTATAKATQGDTPNMQWSPLKTTGIITIGIGAATLIAGTITGSLAVSKSDQLSDKCSRETVCDERNEALHHEADTLIGTTNVLFVTGTILSTAGIVLTVVGHRKHRKLEKLTIKPTPLLSPKMAGLFFQGSF